MITSIIARRVVFAGLTVCLGLQAHAAGPAKGRIVHVTIPGNATLSLAEVQVFSGGKNVALGKKAMQGSMAHGGVAARAVDGNTDGNWAGNSITHTPENQPDPTWEVDLGADVSIEKIVLWNRTGYESRLNKVQVYVLDAKRAVVWGGRMETTGSGQNTFDVAGADGKLLAGKSVPVIKAQQAAPAAAPGPKHSSEAQRRAANRGILNGPLMEGGHRATGEGNRESLRLAIENLIATFPDKYPKGVEFLTRLDAIDSEASPQFEELKREALLANPLLDFDKLLLVRSRGGGRRYSANWQTRVSCDSRGRSISDRDLRNLLGRLDQKDEKLKTLLNYDDELVTLSLSSGEVTPVYAPTGRGLIADVDLHVDGDRLIFSSFIDTSTLSKGSGYGKGYAIFELKIDPTTGLPHGTERVVSPDMGSDSDCYDGCYLPDGGILFASTASYEGVPCVGGADYVANLYRINGDGTGVRRLTFDQDGNWYPTVMENGRVLYLRWEYTDSAHYFARVLMSMNPDGTDQKAFYGSNSYWPNSMFFARPIPGKPSMFCATITGHHSNPKGGALCLFDVAKGRHEADGAVQFITGRGKKVEPLVIDNLCNSYDPKFYEPWPLNENYFFAITGSSVYLVDAFDNMLCLKQRDDQGGYSEPVPLRKRPAPFVRPDSVRPDKKEASVIISDIYEGPGLAGVPRGTVKNLRVYRYEYGPRRKGGHYAMGMETCWDAKQVLGTAPVESDGSASFMVPVNTPFAVQPLDEDGQALAIMRSWTVAMPGESLSCIGCHESQNMAPPMRRAKAMSREPSQLKPFFGPTRGFSFSREVQPVLDKHCISCHDGAPANGRYKVADRVIGTGANTGKKFAEVGIPNLSDSRNSHRELHPYVRRTGPEGDYHVLTPLEFHSDTSELVQMLKKGHPGSDAAAPQQGTVQLDAEAWERLYTWIDLNAPFHGTWTEVGAGKEILDRRLELRKQFADDDYDPEKIVNPYQRSTNVVMPVVTAAAGEDGFAVRRKADVVQAEAKAGPLVLDLGDDIVLRLVSAPAGEFSMGSNAETQMERPVSRVKIAEPFWIGSTEVTLEQYRQFDPKHLNGVYDMHYKDQVHRGYYMNDMAFPVIRVPWHKAMEFCEWLSKKSGKKVSLPTEAQWEWACRAGTETPLSYGDLDADFGPHANLADITVKQMAVSGVNPRPIRNPNSTVDFELKDPRFDDGVLHLAKVGSYQPNDWGVHDMHGNAAEWTRSAYKPYPYESSDDGGEEKVVRGGSWHDRPFRATASYRLGFPAWQQVYHTGFRIVVEE